MRTIYASIIILFCASISLYAESAWNLRPFSGFSDVPVYCVYERSFFEPFDNSRFSIESRFQVFNSFGSNDFGDDGWLDLPGTGGDPQKVPIENGLRVLLLIALFHTVLLVVKLRMRRRS